LEEIRGQGARRAVPLSEAPRGGRKARGAYDNNDILMAIVASDRQRGARKLVSQKGRGHIAGENKRLNPGNGTCGEGKIAAVAETERVGTAYASVIERPAWADILLSTT